MKKKRVLIMILLAALFVTAMPAVTLPMEVHAATNPPPHVTCPREGYHTWIYLSDWYKAPTCTTDGEETWHCTRHGTYWTDTLPATGHTWGPVPGSTQAPGADGWITEAEATCTAGGRQFRNCSQCGFREDRTTNALGHAYDGGRVTKEASCTEAGVNTFTCTRCNETKTEQIAAKGHNYQTNVTRQATCTQEGEKETKCTVCGDTKKEVIPKIAHNYQTTVTKEATCTADGVKTTKCTLCGEMKTEAIPKLGHNYQETVTKQATCTEEGEKQTKCTRCNDAKTEKTAALGHDWNRSVTRDPEGFIDGESFATCRRCGEEEIQTLSAGTALFNKLRHTDPNLANKQENTEELVITEQTEGEFDLSRGSGEQITLSVTVEGGVEPYSYEWHAVLHSTVNLGRPATSWSVPQSSGRISSAKASAMNKYRAGGKRGTRKARQRSSSVGAVLRQGRDIVVSTEGATYVASEGERDYYCIITDAAGNRVESTPVSLYHMPYISRQPQGGNLHDGPVTLTCQVSGGRGTEDALYEWFAVDGTLAGEDPECIIREEGEYYCDIYVGSADEPLTSQTVKVVNTEPLKLWVESEEIEWEPEEGEREIGFYYRGGTAPYTIQHYVNGTLRKEDTITEKEWDGMDAAVYYVRLAAYETEQDTYALTVTDADGETQSAYTTVMPYKLEIEEQPQDVMISKNGGPVRLDVTLYEGTGEPPYTYILYYGSKEYVVGKKTNDLTFGNTVWKPGFYFFHIEDSKGRYVYSDSAKVSPYEKTLEITDHTESGKIYRTGGFSTLYAYVKGGNAPYTYQWQYLPYWAEEDGGMLWQDVNEKSSSSDWSSYNATYPGTYRCIVSDKNGETERTENISVSYEGDGVFITDQPADVLLDYREDDAYSAGMYCNAASGSGDDSTLRYTWEKKRSNGLWWPSGTAQTKWAKGSAEDICGIYRCKVYDSKTETTTYSREVKVDVKMAVEITRIVPRDAVYYDVYYRVVGGVAPYKVSASKRQMQGRIDRIGTDYVEYSCGFQTRSDNKESYFLFELPYKFVVLHRDKPLEQSAFAEIKITAVDASGKSISTDWISYHEFVKGQK